MSYNPQAGPKQTLRLASVALTNGTFDATAALRVQNWNQCMLYCTVASFAATSVDIEVDFACPDFGPAGQEVEPVTADWFTRTFQDTAAATASTVTMAVPIRKWRATLVGNGLYEIPIPICARYMRVRSQTTGAPAGTTLKIEAVQGMA